MTAAPRTLHHFSLDELVQFTAAKSYPPEGSLDYRAFYVGLDDVHEILKFLLSGCTMSLSCNMFGFDDEELNGVIMSLVKNPAVLTQITLDKSQAGGVHEKKLVDLDRQTLGTDFNTHFAVGQSATHSISHTKGGVIDGIVAWEGSTNWSADGEGTFVVKGQPGGPGYRAQNNTVIVPASSAPGGSGETAGVP